MPGPPAGRPPGPGVGSPGGCRLVPGTLAGGRQLNAVSVRRQRASTLFCVRRPSGLQIGAYLADRAGAPFTYPEVGVTRGGRLSLPPSVTRDYNVDHHETVL